MNDGDRTKEDLIRELSELRRRVSELDASGLDRPETEDLLSRGEGWYGAVFRNIGIGIGIVDGSGKWIVANTAAANILGCTPEELKGVSVMEVTHPDDLEASRKSFQALVGGRINQYRLEKRYIRKDGVNAWVDLSVSPIRDADGKIVATAGVMVDITDRKNAEEELRKSEQKLAWIFEMTPEPIAITRMSDGAFLNINKAFTQVMGYTLDEIKGLPSGKLGNYADPGARDAMVEKLRQDGRVDQREIQFVRKDGSAIWGELSAVITEIEGKSCVLSVTRDITDKKIKWIGELI